MRNIASIKEKILEYLEYKGVSKYRFYLDSGIARGVLDKPTGLTEDNIAKFIIYAQDIALEWLFLSKGSMIKDENSSENFETKSRDEYRLIIQGLKNENSILKSELSNKDKLLDVQEEMIELLRSENRRLKGEDLNTKRGSA